MLGTKTIYRIKADYQENIWPYNGVYDFGEIKLDIATADKPAVLFNIIQNALIDLKKSNAIFSRKLRIIYPAANLNFNLKSEDSKYMLGIDALKISKKGGDDILKSGAISDNLYEILKEAASVRLTK